MIKVNSKIKINKQKVKEIEQACLKSLEQTAEATKTELIACAYMPFDTGHMQNESTFVDNSEIQNGKASIVSSTPYARKVYFNPNGFTIHRTHNANAIDHWFEPFIHGENKDFIPDAFKKFLKKNL